MTEQVYESLLLIPDFVHLIYFSDEKTKVHQRK